MANEERVLVLRDADGNYYLISGNAIEAGRVPEERWAELEEAMGGDVAGYFFDTKFQTALTNLNQQNFQSANNVVVGALVVASPQTINQFAGNTANVTNVQA